MDELIERREELKMVSDAIGIMVAINFEEQFGSAAGDCSEYDAAFRLSRRWCPCALKVVMRYVLTRLNICLDEAHEYWSVQKFASLIAYDWLRKPYSGYSHRNPKLNMNNLLDHKTPS